MKKNKKIIIESDCLGDTIAWVPIIDKYRQVNNYRITLACNYRDIFVKEYPELLFVDKAGVQEGGHDIALTLSHFITDTDFKGEPIAKGLVPNMEFHKKDWRTTSLQQIASDILDLPPEEVQSKVEVPDLEPSVIGKYVCIGTQSTIQNKYWNNPDGWQDVVDYLRGKGYNVVCIDQHRYYGHSDSNTWNTIPHGVIDKTNSGLDLWDRINDLHHAEFFIGLGSGLSWLSWAVGTHTFMISGFSDPFYEFQSNITRISQDDINVCSGCFNNAKYPFERDNWNWCPEHIGTEREYECSKRISSDTVIEHIEKWIQV